MNDLLELYRLHHPGLKDNTYYQYTRAHGSLADFRGEPVRVTQLTKELVLRWMAARLQQVAPRTVKRERGDLLTLWRFAFSEGYHSADPDLLGIPTVRIPKKSPVGWRLHELERWLSACSLLSGRIKETQITKADWWRSYVLFLYDTGARPTAALEVCPSDIEMDCKCVVLRAEVAKTSTDTICLLSDQAVEAIQKHYDVDRETVFPWPYNPRQLWYQYKQVNRKAKLPDDRYHSVGCMRRTAASHAAAHGSVDMAAQLLGHTTSSTTVRHYIDPRIANQQPAINVLPRPQA